MYLSRESGPVRALGGPPVLQTLLVPPISFILASTSGVWRIATEGDRDSSDVGGRIPETTRVREKSRLDPISTLTYQESELLSYSRQKRHQVPLGKKDKD